MNAIKWIKAASITQKAMMGIGSLAILGVVGFGVYNLYHQPAEVKLPVAEKKVEVQKVEPKKNEVTTNPVAPAVATPVEQPAWNGDMSNVVESNAGTETVTNQGDYYSGSEGGRYEAPQVDDGNWAEEPSYDGGGGYYEEPASGGGYEEPASPPPTSGGDTGGGSTEGDWDGSFGGDEWTPGDYDDFGNGEAN